MSNRKMEVGWYKLLYFSLMCVGFASSHNVTTGPHYLNLTIPTTTSSSIPVSVPSTVAILEYSIPKSSGTMVITPTLTQTPLLMSTSSSTALDSSIFILGKNVTMSSNVTVMTSSSFQSSLMFKSSDDVNLMIPTTLLSPTPAVPVATATTSYYNPTSSGNITFPTPTPQSNLTIVSITASTNLLWRTVRLKCEVQGSPSPYVWWTRNVSHGTNIYFEDENKILVIVTSLLGDIGTYYCHAKNKLSYVNASFELNLIDTPVGFIQAKKDGSSFSGQVELNRWLKGFVVVCYGRGYPNVKVVWNKVPNSILESLNSSTNTRVYESRYHNRQSDHSYLHFNEVHCEDAGIYMCEITIEGYDYVTTRSIELICSHNFNQTILATSPSSTTIAPSPHVTVPYSNPTSRLIINGTNSTESPTYPWNSSERIKWAATKPILVSPMTLAINSTPIYPRTFYKTSVMATSSSTRLSSSILILPTTKATSNPYLMATSSSTRLSSSILILPTTTPTSNPYYLNNSTITGDQNIYRGGNISLTCHGNGHPYPLFTWYFHGQQLWTNSTIRILGNKLDIFNATMNDGGEYICKAYNLVGNVTSGLVVNVMDIPSVVFRTRATNDTLVGTQIDMVCYISLYLFEIEKMELFKDGTLFHQWIGGFNRYYYTYYTPARHNLTGKYQCKVTVGAASRYSSPFYLTIRDSSTTTNPPIIPDSSTTTNPPTIPVPRKISVTPINPTATEHSSIILFCDCTCSIQPNWFKNNRSLQYPAPGSPFTLLANGSLLINVTRHTAGNYSCEIRTSSWTERSGEVRLEVWYLNNSTITGSQYIYRGENISLTCHGNGHPYPQFTWYFQGQQLRTNFRIRISGNKLDIFNATVDDGGEYICTASSLAGHVSKGHAVTVRELPFISLWRNTTEHILVETGIIFTCRSHVHFSSNIPINSTMELLKDGRSFYQWMLGYFWHHYYFSTPGYRATPQHTGKYQCKLTIGAASRYSSPSYLAVGVPSGAVVLEKEPETSATGIRISWKPISKKFWNGEEITFQVNVSLPDDTLKKSYVTKTTSAIISNLLPATRYIVVIAGSTVFGPIEDRTITVTTKENIDRCENADSNSCHEYAHCKNVVGNYICTCFEGFFGDGKECQGPPQIISKSEENIVEDVETNLTLVCTVIADPNPTTVWTHIDAKGKFREIKRTTDKFNGNYTIHNARVEDSGTYLCNASNALGKVFYATKIKIEPVIVNISVEIKLSNKTFNEELKNESSPAYIELKNDVYVELYNFFNNTPGFEDIEILGFVNGSVKVLFRVIVKVLKPSKKTNDVVAVSVGRKIYKQLKTGRIGKFAVVPDALKLNAEPPPPGNVSYSGVAETKVDIAWYPPELHELFSIKRYYISFLKHGEKIWSNGTLVADELDESLNFQLNNLESDTFYTLKVTAENEFYLGKESKRMEIKTLKVKVISPWYYVGPIIAVASIVLLVAAVCFIRRISLSDAWRPVEDGELHCNRKEGKTTFQMLERNPNENTYTNPGFSDPLTKPAWQQIPRTSIEISGETLIPGEFGITVVRGTFSSVLGKNKEACSIKMLKESGTAEERRELMNELRTISSISSHDNVVNLIGACTSKDGPLLVVLEYCPRGTLESNLRDSDKRKEMLIKKNTISLTNDIAKGMRHLADSRIVHRGLAAGNILMTEDYTPKISNFGLSRDIYEQSLYHKLNQGNSCTQWLAIESLTDGLYTAKSDVWSFAVVMWEIETGGRIPYEEIGVKELVSQLNKGYRLSKPDSTSDETYKLMLQCWDENPDNRPTFQKIVEIIEMNLKVNTESMVDIPLNIAT